MSYYPEPVVLNLSNYATKKKLEHATGVDTSDLAVEKDLIALKSEVETNETIIMM